MFKIPHSMLAGRPGLASLKCHNNFPSPIQSPGDLFLSNINYKWQNSEPVI